jgi:HK97 gp10 family phage protein
MAIPLLAGAAARIVASAVGGVGRALLKRKLNGLVDLELSVEMIEKDLGWAKITKELEKEKDAYVKIGVLSTAGQYEEGGKANLADVATFNEFGTKDIPPRPFMKQAFDNNQREVNGFIDKQYNSVLTGKQSIKGGLQRIGAFFEGKVKKIFRDGSFEPNKPETIKKKTRAGKKGTTPLVNTGQLRGSISHEVVMKGGK